MANGCPGASCVGCSFIGSGFRGMVKGLTDGQIAEVRDGLRARIDGAGGVVDASSLVGPGRRR